MTRDFRIIYDPSHGPNNAKDRDAPHRELIGYVLPAMHASPGESVSLAVSTTEPTFSSRIVRLLHGDTNVKGPGHVYGVLDDNGTRSGSLDEVKQFPGKLQEIRGGSWAVVGLENASKPDSLASTIGCHIWPTIPATAGHDQVILSRGAFARSPRHPPSQPTRPSPTHGTHNNPSRSPNNSRHIPPMELHDNRPSSLARRIQCRAFPRRRLGRCAMGA